MTDIETNENEEEKKESWYAKLRASLKEKYEGQINDLQAKISDLESGRAADKKSFFNRILKWEWFEGNFDEFADKYSSLWVDEMVALYKWMNGKPAPVAEEPKEETKEELGSKSVLGTNPTEVNSGEDVSKMNWQQYLDYIKQNMSKLGLG